MKRGFRHKVGLSADVGAWDVHHCALLVALGADAVCPWLGCVTAGECADAYLKGVRTGFVEAMSMIGVTPASAYCGAKLVEAVGLDPAFVEQEFAGVATHLGGIGADVLDREWLDFHHHAFLPDVQEADRGRGVPVPPRRAAALQQPGCRPRAARSVRDCQARHDARAGICGGVFGVQRGDSRRDPVTLLDLVRIREGVPIPVEDVEPEECILWRFMVPGMSEGALSEPAHRTIARAMNVLHRYCRLRFARAGIPVPDSIGPVANSGEGGFAKERMLRADGNRSVQYAGGRFTITPMTAARAAEAEVKFAQGAKPGKGGQLPGARCHRASRISVGASRASNSCRRPSITTSTRSRT